MLNKSNIQDITETLANLAKVNDNIISTFNKLENGNVLGNIMNLYKDELTKFSGYIKDKMIKYSKKLDLDGLKDGHSIFFPNYGKIRDCSIKKGYVPTASYARDLPVNWFLGDMCNAEISFTFVDQYTHSHHYDANDLARRGINPNLYCFNSLNYKVNKDSRFKDWVKIRNADELKNLREAFFKEIKEDQGYKDYLSNLKILEILAKNYANLLGKSFELDFLWGVTNKIADMEKVYIYDNINPEVINDFKIDIDAKFENWQRLDSKSYKTTGELFKQQIDFANNFVNLLIKTEEIKQSEGAQPDELKEAHITEDFQVKKSKIEKAYLELKSLFQEILKQSSDINEAIENKPEKAEKFNLLLANVHLEETFSISGIPKDLTFDQLKTYQCEVHCVNRYAMRYDAGYRAFMDGDQHMNNVIGLIKDINNGEAPACDC